MTPKQPLERDRTSPDTRRIRLRYREQTYEIEVRRGSDGEIALRLHPVASAETVREVSARVEPFAPDGSVLQVLTPEGTRSVVLAPTEAGGLWMTDGRRTCLLELEPRSPGSSPPSEREGDPARRRTPRAGTETGAEIRAPMTGRIVQVAVRPGQPVREGEVLVVLEAMKMEYRLEAPHDGVVAEIACEPDQQVDLGEVLVRLRPPQAPSEQAQEVRTA